MMKNFTNLLLILALFFQTSAGLSIQPDAWNHPPNASSMDQCSCSCCKAGQSCPLAVKIETECPCIAPTDKIPASSLPESRPVRVEQQVGVLEPNALAAASILIFAGPRIRPNSLPEFVVSSFQSLLCTWRI
jgi:hypothetical protein